MQIYTHNPLFCEMKLKSKHPSVYSHKLIISEGCLTRSAIRNCKMVKPKRNNEIIKGEARVTFICDDYAILSKPGLNGTIYVPASQVCTITKYLWYCDFGGNKSTAINEIHNKGVRKLVVRRGPKGFSQGKSWTRWHGQIYGGRSEREEWRAMAGRWQIRQENPPAQTILRRRSHIPSRRSRAIRIHSIKKRSVWLISISYTITQTKQRKHEAPVSVSIVTCLRITGRHKR